MLNIAICDDDTNFSEQLADLVKQFYPEDCRVRIFSHAEPLRREISGTYHPDIVLLDIQIGSENGIALAQQIFPAASDTAVIFVTGYVSYCTEVYEADHIYFLLKPVQPSDLHRALEKAVADLGKRSALAIAIKVNGELRRVDVDKIRFVESSYRKLYLHLHDEVLSLYGSLSENPGLLGDSFFQCHKSFLVNCQYIQSIKSNAFVLIDGTIVPISQKRYAESRTFFLDYLRKQLGGV